MNKFQIGDNVKFLIPVSCTIVDKINDLYLLNVNHFNEFAGFQLGIQYSRDSQFFVSLKNENYHVMHLGYKVEDDPEPERFKRGDPVLVKLNSGDYELFIFDHLDINEHTGEKRYFVLNHLGEERIFKNCIPYAENRQLFINKTSF